MVVILPSEKEVIRDGRQGETIHRCGSAAENRTTSVRDLGKRRRSPRSRIRPLASGRGRYPIIATHDTDAECPTAIDACEGQRQEIKPTSRADRKKPRAGANCLALDWTCYEFAAAAIFAGRCLECWRRRLRRLNCHDIDGSSRTAVTAVVFRADTHINQRGGVRSMKGSFADQSRQHQRACRD